MSPFAIFSDASHYGMSIDRLFIGLVAVSAVIVVIVFGLVIGFSIRYRRGSAARRGPLPPLVRRELEIGWTAATFFLFLFIFWWAAASQLSALTSGQKPLEIHVVAKQWMWKVQQPNGTREINEIHAPVDRPVRLVMTSQDVIHSLFLPALRMKQDVLPGRYTYLTFNAERPGVYHLLCAEFCGTDHSLMTGRFVLMQPADYAEWLAAEPANAGLAAKGEELFRSLNCSGCHGANSTVHAPDLDGLYGRPVHLADGSVVTADEVYLRDSILQPRDAVVAGFQPTMPSFKGEVSEDQLVSLIAYLKSLSAAAVINDQGQRQ